MNGKHTIFITGAAGYVGAMLVKHFAKDESIERIVGLDKEEFPEFLSGVDKLVYICMNTSEDWTAEVAGYTPDIVIHTAWQIREMYGDQETEWEWNVTGSDNVFAFAFSNSFVKRLVHFSTVASYGAFKDNTIEHRFKESEPFRESEYLYAEEKRVTEVHLEERYAVRENKDIAVSIVRPAAVTGPRGRFMRIRFGLQSALSGQLKDSFAYRAVSALVSFVPVTKKWLRQFIHEDDVVGIVDRLALGDSANGNGSEYEVFNICPPGNPVLAPDMAKAVGKKTFPIHPWLICIAFFIFWHLTRGKIPTGRGAWRGYSYPIAVDGSKVTEMLGYKYQHNSFDSFYYTNGAYEEFVPEASRRHKK